MSAPLISVIVPVYKAEAFLRQCAASVLAQDHRELELLLVDDGSPDGSGRLCDELAAGDARVRAFHKTNGGPSSARNLALREARGELLFFLDADDLLPPGSLALLARNFAATEADMVVGAFSRFTDTSAPVPALPAFPAPRLLSGPQLADYAFSYLRAPNRNLLFAYSWGRLFRASLVRGAELRFDETLHTFEDVAFNFEFLKSARSVSFVDDLVYLHRSYTAFSSATMNITGGLDRMFGFRAAIRAISSYLEMAAPGQAVAAAAAHANVTLTIIQLVRVCGQVDGENSAAIAGLVRDLVEAPGLQSDLAHYSPSGKDSRLLPLLMRLKLVRLIILVCRYKAYKRYGKGARA